MLFILPPIGIALLWIFQKEIKEKSKIILTVVSILWLFSFLNSNASKPVSTESQTICLYDDKNVEIRQVMNGSRTEIIGQYSIIKVKSTDATDDNLSDWYYNYVIQNDYNWCMILYTDKNDNSGVYSINGMVQKDVLFQENKYGDYMLGDTSKAITYVPRNDNKLEVRK